jgi:hypothetical protein
MGGKLARRMDNEGRKECREELDAGLSGSFNVSTF